MSVPHDILLVEDEPAIRQLLHRMLGRAGYSVRTAGTGQQALITLAHQRPSVLILDLILPVMNGFAVLDYIHTHHIVVPTIIMTSQMRPYDALHHPNIVRVLVKPFWMQEFLDAVQEATHRQCVS